MQWLSWRTENGGIRSISPYSVYKWENADQNNSEYGTFFQQCQRMKFSRRAATTSRPVITLSLWIKATSQFLHDISDKVILYNFPDEFIISADQTPLKYVTVDNAAMAAKGKKHIFRTGSRSITLTLCTSHNGTILLFQLTFKRKNSKIATKCWFSWLFLLLAQWKILKQWNWDHSLH